MPATIRYKSGYPSRTKPVEQSASIDALGVVTISASFLVEPYTTPFQAGQQLSPKLFTCLSGAQVVGLAVESVQSKKENGLGLCQVQLIGILRDIKIVKSSQMSLRTFSKTRQFIDKEGTKDLTLSFDYYSETVTWSWVGLTGLKTTITPPSTARFGPRFNIQGKGRLIQIVGPGLPPAKTTSELIAANETFITTNTEEERGNVTQYTATVEAIYQ